MGDLLNRKFDLSFLSNLHTVQWLGFIQPGLGTLVLLISIFCCSFNLYSTSCSLIVPCSNSEMKRLSIYPQIKSAHIGCWDQGIGIVSTQTKISQFMRLNVIWWKYFGNFLFLSRMMEGMEVECIFTCFSRKTAGKNCYWKENKYIMHEIDGRFNFWNLFLLRKLFFTIKIPFNPSNFYDLIYQTEKFERKSTSFQNENFPRKMNNLFS